MIRIHCTKKLLAKLPVQDDGRLPRPLNDEMGTESPLSGWHANLLLMQRRQCVLFVHNATRFPVFVPALKKADFWDLDYYFQDIFMNTLLKLGAEHSQMKAAEQLLAPLVCDTQTNRSVQGTLNRMGMELEMTLADEEFPLTEISPYWASRHMAERCFQIKGKGYVFPGEEMLQWLAGNKR